MAKGDEYPELAGITKGSSFRQVFTFLHRASLLRYATRSHLNSLNPKLGTPKKIAQLADFGFLTAVNSGQAYITTQKTWEILKAEGFNTKPIQKKLTGESLKHALEITSVILGEMKRPFFYSVIYPHFGYLIPDACLAYRKDTATKITFLEVENEKGNWTEYLEKKKRAYERLSHDYDIYCKWWKVWAGKLKIPFCNVDDFCFSILCVANTRRDWEGWTWRTN